MTMQIRNQKIAGHPAVRVRNALRRIGGRDYFDANILFVESLHIADGEEITKALLELGHIEPTTPKFAWEDKNIDWYALTEKGASFARASGMTRMPRSKAESVLTPFLNRIAEMNAGPYAFSVVKAVIFGSFTRDSEQTLGDLDIAVELKSRYTDDSERNHAEEERRGIAVKNGRRFSNIVERIGWPQEEVFKVLKARQLYLSLHSVRDLFEMAERDNALIPHRVIFGSRLIFPTEIAD